VSATRDQLSLFVSGTEGERLDALRRQLLGRRDIRHQSAHLTLAHPRNPKATGNRLPLAELGEGLTLTLTDLRWIRQTGVQPWQTLIRCPAAGGATASTT
jgi:hypothetical protein